jgi:hypothetical protein
VLLFIAAQTHFFHVRAFARLFLNRSN